VLCVYCRQTESRRVAVSGFLMLLNNFNTLAGNFMSSQSASQSSCVGSSQVHATGCVVSVSVNNYTLNHKKVTFYF